MAPISGAYTTHHFTACTGCGQLCRIEVMMPVVTLSDKRMIGYCPMCGKEWHYTPPYSNSSSYRLVAEAMFNREPSDDEVQIVESIYQEWDATVFPKFKDFLKALIQQGTK